MKIRGLLKLVLLIVLISIVSSKKLCAVSTNDNEAFFKVNTSTVITAGSSLQAAIDAAAEGDTISVPPGTYTSVGRITINKGISLIGQDEATTIIDVSGNGTDYGILIAASNVRMSNFKIKPPVVSGSLGTSSGGGYGIHATTNYSNITLSHLTIENGNRTGVDINGVDSLTLEYITSRNAAYGNGISMTGVVHATVSNIATSNNAWGGMAVYVSTQVGRGSDDINIDFSSSSIPEANKIYVQNESGLFSTNITVTGCDYIVKNDFNAESSGYTFYQDNLTNAATMAVTWIPLKWAGSAPYSSIQQLSTGEYFVETGMSIQAAIDAASSGNIINVSGTYTETITINTAGIILKGDPGAIDKIGAGLSAPNVTSAGSFSLATLSINAANVTITGFNITNSTGPYGIHVKAANAEVSYNRIHDINGAASGDGIRAIFINPVDNVVIKRNIVEDFGNATNTAAASWRKTAAGIFVWARGGTLPGGIADISLFSNITIEDNIIRNNNLPKFTGTPVIGIWAGGSQGNSEMNSLNILRNQISNLQSVYTTYGFAVDHGVNATGYSSQLIVSNNTISNLSGAYVHAIGLEGNTPSASITGNTISSLTADSTSGSTAIRFEDNPGASTVSLTSNTFDGNNNLSNSTSTIAVSGDWSSLDSLTNNTYPEVILNSAYYYYGINAFSTIQAGIDAASAGDIIKVGAGTFNNSITINKRLTLIGTVASDAIVTKLYPIGDDPIIELTGSGQSGSPLTLKNLHLYPNYDPGKGKDGIHISDGISVSYIDIDNVYFTGTNRIYPGLESGIYVDMDASVSNINVTNCNFTHLAYGIVVNKLSTSSSVFTNASISNSTFNDNISKGMYFEKLSNSTISSCTFTDNGDITLAASWAQAYCTALDINLKYGTYSDITLSGLTFSNNGIGSTYGSALSVKARGTGNDPSYAGNPATLGNVNITGCIFQNNKANFRLGEPGKDNTSPTGLVVEGNSFLTPVEVSVQNNTTGSVDVKGNWWGVASPDWLTSISGDVSYTPWWRNNYNGDSHSTGWSWGSNGNLQTSINTVSPGDTLLVLAGTYDEAFNINKRITLIGEGSDLAGTVFQSTNPPIVTTGETYPSGYRPVIILSASGNSGAPILFKNLMIRPRQDIIGAAYPHPAVLLNPAADLSYIEFNNVRIIGTKSENTPESGIVIDGSTSLNHLVVDNSEFSDMAYGTVIYKSTTSSTNVQNIEIKNTTYSNNSIKGFYAEKLSDAAFSNLTVTDNGDPNLSPPWADANNAGIDINLKYGSYQNISFSNMTVTGNGIGSSNGTGLSIKARDDSPSYNTNPATLTGVTVTKCVFNGNTNNIAFGESGKSNTGPSNVTINNNSLTGSAYGIMDQRAASADTIDATGNWWGVAEGPDDNSSDGTAFYNTSTGEKISETSDKKIAYAPWYSVTPEDNASLPGVTQTSPKVFLVKESVPFASKGYINKGIQLASLNYIDTIDVQLTNVTEIPAVDRKVVIKFASPPVLDSLDITNDFELSSDITISGGLNLGSGNIMTGSSNKVVLDTTVTNIVETSTARIIGTVEVKPRTVGTGSIQLLGLEIQSGADNLGKVGFTRKSGDDGVVNVSGNTGVGMTWEISVDSQPTSGRDVTFKWLPEFDNGVDPSSVIVYRNTGFGWVQYAGPFNASGNPRQVTVNVSGFSDWTIGSSSAPLPVELLSFSAKLIEDKVELRWATATEVNNYGYEIERSTLSSQLSENSNNKTDEGDRIWEKIGFVNGYGNSNSQKNYLFTDVKIPYGSMEYRLKQIDFDGSSEYSSIVKIISNLITENKLDQNYPNPFNPSTNISFALPKNSNVRLEIYDMLGQLVRSLISQNMDAGYHEATWDSKNNFGKTVAGGIYVYRLITNDFAQTKKMLLIK